MAHALDTRDNGNASFVSLRKSAWHQLGTIAQDELSYDEAMELGGLNYPLIARPVTTSLPIFDVNGREIDSLELQAPAQAIIRADRQEVFGVVGPQYRIVTNRQATALVGEMVEQGLFRIETAGALRGGRDAWMLGRFVGEAFDAAGDNGGDAVRFYGLVRTNHSGECSVQIGTTPVRVVCANTLAMALRNGQSTIHKVRHTSNARTRIAEAARAVWGSALADAAAQAEGFTSLREVELTREQFVREVLDVVVPIPTLDGRTGKLTPRMVTLHQTATARAMEERFTIERLLTTGAGNDGSLSGWNVFNAVTEAIDHHGVAGAQRGAAKREALVAQLPGGTAAALKATVWNGLLSLTA